MVDDGNAVIIAKRTGEADDPRGRDQDFRAAAGGERQAARTDPARIDLAEPFEDPRISREPVVERWPWQAALRPAGPRWRWAEGGDFGGDLGGRAVAARFLGQPLDVLADRQRDVARAQRRAAGQGRRAQCPRL